MSTAVRRRVVCFHAVFACLMVGTGAAGGARAAQLADPTRPTGASDAGPEETSGVHVQAIIVRAGTRVAIVSGHVVHAGDRLGGVLIEEVTPEGVRYLQHGHSAFARLAAETVVVRRVPSSGGTVP
jgi:hypothetical protein